MKKTLVAALLGLATIAGVQAQSGFIQLYNYSYGAVPNPIVYGVGSGGTVGQPVSGGFTVGMYYGIGDITAAVNASMPGATDIPGAGMLLASGQGSTAPLGTDGYNPGQYGNSFVFYVPGTSDTTPAAVSVVVVAYNGADYATSAIRGHSAAFLMTTATGVLAPPTTGAVMAGFSVVPVPEPSTFALAGLGLASLVIFRRRK